MASIARSRSKRKSARSHDRKSPTLFDRLQHDTPKIASGAAYADQVIAASHAEGVERPVLYFLANHADPESDEVEMGQQTLALSFGVDRKTMKEILRRLRKLGELTLVRRAGGWGRTNRYRITLPHRPS